MQRYAILKQIDVKGYFSECKKPCFHITFFLSSLLKVVLPN
jgi:hypothetical protein